MTVKLDLAAEKLLRKVRAARQKWIDAVKSSSTLDEYVRKVAQVTGLDEATVRNSIPVANYRDFQQHAEEYVDLLISNVEAAIRNKKWQKRYTEAFRTPPSS